MSDIFNFEDTDNGFRTRTDGRILIVTLCRAPLNTMPPSIHRPVEAVWDAFFADSNLCVAILTAEGDKAFSVGSDITAYDAGMKSNLPANGALGLTARRTTKPVIAAVNGLALGGGLEVMLACDIVIAAEHSVFGLPEVKLGAAPLAGGVSRICRKIPYGIGLAVSFGVQQLDAQQALTYGLINAIVPRGQALTVAMDWAGTIADCGPVAVRAVKEIADMTLEGHEMSDMLQHASGPLEKMVMESVDMREGMAAFLARRKPVWVGK